MASRLERQAESLIRQTGTRLTRARTRVLAFLLGQRRPLTHHDIQARLPGEAIDGVTLYRVLDWLDANGLAHRIAGSDQVWRFSANAGASAGKADHEHAHFQCVRCDSVTCFTEIPMPRRVKLPAGFTSQDVDFLIKGLCPRCGGG